MTSSAIKAAWDAIDADSGFVTGLTADLVRIPSVNPKFQSDPELNREPEVQAHLDKVLSAEGFRCERWDALEGRPNLVADWAGSEERSLILNGHIDVVPVGDTGSWTRKPFAGEIDAGRIWGRGAVDMKGGVAACVAAARAIRKAGIRLEGRLSIHTVVDEEAGGFGTMDIVKKGRLAAAALVAEPTWGDVIPAEGGLEWCRVTIRGKQAHAGFRFNEIFPQPQVEGRLVPGVNAIELATRFLVALRDFEQARCRSVWHPLVPPGLCTINPGVIRGGAGLGADGNPMIMSNAAIVPDVVTIDLDYKYMPHEDSAAVRAEFEAFLHHFAQTDPWMREHPPTVQWGLYGLHFPAVNTPVDHPLTQAVLKRATELRPGRPPKVRGFEAVTDAAFYAGAGMPVVVYGPSGDGFHGADECVEIDSLIDTTKVIAAAVIDACGVAE